MTLVETGTRAVIAAVFGPTREGETSYATRLLHHLGPQMLVLWDRGFDSNDFRAAVHATGARVLGRIRQRRRPPVLQPLADSSYLSVIGGVRVRIIEAQVSLTCTDGSNFEDSYRLVTTLLDARRHPADRLAPSLRALGTRERLLPAPLHRPARTRPALAPPGRHRAGDVAPAHPLPGSASCHGRGSGVRPDTDPHRCGFTVALQTTRDSARTYAEQVGGGDDRDEGLFGPSASFEEPVRKVTALAQLGGRPVRRCRPSCPTRLGGSRCGG